MRVRKKLLIKKTATFFIGRKTRLPSVQYLGRCVVAETSSHLANVVKNQVNQWKGYKHSARIWNPTVPSFVHVAGGQINVRTSSMSNQRVQDYKDIKEGWTKTTSNYQNETFP